MPKRMGSLNRTIKSTVFLNGMEVDLDLDVHYDYIPGTPESGVAGPPENYDPGDPGTVDITAIFYEDSDIKPHLSVLELETLANEIEELEVEDSMCIDNRGN